MKRSTTRYVTLVVRQSFRQLLFLFGCSVLFLFLDAPARAAAPVAPMPLISRNVPVFASGSISGVSPAAANDANYQSLWFPTALPAWIAYDLSSVPVDQRQQVLVAWYAGRALGYINTTPGEFLSLPIDYTIEINSAAGGTGTPTTGWQNVVTVTGNNRGSRQHLIPLAGANWVRFRATASSNPANVGIDLDIHSAPAGASDCWLFMGDSITGFAAYLFSDLPGKVNAMAPNRWPVVVPAAIGGSNAWSANDVIDESISLYPGRFVTLNYGTNGGSDGFSAAMEVLIQKVLAAGKIPVIPHMPWSDIPEQLAKAPLINAQIDALYQKYPTIVRGPDLYAAFLNRPDWIASGDVHPNDAGNQEMRRQWALAMTATSISPAVVSVVLSPSTSTVTAGATQPFTATVTGTSNSNVQWTIQEGSAGGSVSTTGFYTAPATAGTFHVVATSVADPSQSATAAVSVHVPVQIPAGFDAAAYLARYPDLQARFGSDLSGAWTYYHDQGIYLGEVFDDNFRVEEYLALYPELFAAFGNDLGAALVHWLTVGRIEGRLGRIPVEFSAAGYLTRNPDVAAAVNNNAILAWQHYWLYGIYEGRAYDDEFRVFEYLALNSDLQAAFLNNDWRGATLHWMRYGRTEGRLGRIPLIFNSTEYLARYPDVAAAWGTYPTTVWLHYWAYGIDESRLFDEELRIDEYLVLNPDLATIFGANRRGAFTHWVRYGRAEGRRGRFAPVAQNLTVAPITSSTAVLNWTTNTAAICSLEYGTTSTYGQTAPTETTYSTSHQITLTGLLPDTVYYYRINSHNSANQQSVSAGTTFRTLAVVTQPPVISAFSASPTSLTTGGSTTLSWTVAGASSLTITPGVGTVTGTSIIVSPATTTTYTLTATNLIGSATQTATVTVTPVVPTTPVISSFAATPATITAGSTSTLNWSVTGATGLSITPGIGPVTGTSTTVSPTTTTTYTLTATNGTTSTMLSSTVTVTPVASAAPVINSFTIDSSSLSTTGMCTLIWNVTGTANLSISPNIGTVTGNVIAVSPLANTTFTLSATNSEGTVTASAFVALNTPALTLEAAPVLQIKRDDHVATIEMDFDDTAWAQLWDVGTAGREGCGYRVQWWADATAVSTILTTDGCTSGNSAGSSGAVPNMSAPRQLVTPNRVVQIQPLANNALYHVRVERINGLGQICSLPTEKTFNGGDGTRVAALRSTMTFFDDFNLPMGAPDERKWNNAMTPQTDPRFNLFFVNDQCHVHTLNGTLNEAAGDKSQVAQRARKPIAIENGVRRRIVFDMDGIFSPRGVWYLDLNPVKVDLTGHMSFFDEDGDKALPAGVLRLKAGNQSFSVHLIDSTGASYIVGDVTLYEKGRKMCSNVRRSFDVRVGTDGIQVFVDGTSVIDVAFPPNAFRAGTYDLLWSTIGYNSSKDNNPYFLSHWDNFGFDGPDLEPRAVHNYVTRIEGTDYQHANAGSNDRPTFTVKIPDDIRPTAPGATSEAWLVFNYMVDRYNYTTIKPGDHVLANGVSYVLPQPANNTSPLDPTLSAVWNNPTTVRIKLGEVQQGGVSPLLVGDNTFKFFAENTGILDLHVEVITPTSAEPPYTPPSALHRVPMHAELPKLGPPAQIVFIDGKEWTQVSDTLVQGPTVSGRTTVECLVGNSNWANWDPQQLNMPANSTEIWGSGGTTGIKSVELFLRRKGSTTGYGDRIAVLTTSRDAPAPQIRYTFEFDTRRYANGDYELYVLGTTTTGVKSHPTFFGSAFRWDPTVWGGAYEPVTITIAN